MHIELLAHFMQFRRIYLLIQGNVAITGEFVLVFTKEN